jgi:hypothetical protein
MESYPISHFARQNEWKKVRLHNELAIVEETGILRAPFGHSFEDVESFRAHVDGSTLQPDARRFHTDLAPGQYVLIPQSGSKPGDRILLSRIDSGVEAGPVPGIVVLCNERACGHKYLRPRKVCVMCDASIIHVIQKKDLTVAEVMELAIARGGGRHIEPLFALYRRVTIIGHVLAPHKDDPVREWYWNWRSIQSFFRATSVSVPHSDVLKTPLQKKKDGDDLMDFLSV